MVLSPDRVSSEKLSVANTTDVMGLPGTCPLTSCIPHVRDA